MIDEIFDRHYQQGRAELNGALLAALTKLGRALLAPFAVLNRIEYQAPWKPAR